MKDYYGKIIDTHTHIYPEKIAQKATDAIGNFYDIAMSATGTVEKLKAEMKKAGVCKSFILSTATTPKQVRDINKFLISVMAENGDIFVPFGTVHPDMDGIIDELDFIRENGIVGLKFHSDFLQIAVDDKRMDVIYSYAQEYGLPIVFHAGDKRYEYSNPDKFYTVYKRFPHLIGIAAHFGGYSEWKASYETLCNTNFYFDTSSSFFELDYDLAKRIIAKRGVDNIFFASDFPMWTAFDELNHIENLRLSDSDTEKILFGNAEKFISSIIK